jgi:ArsR family transcriptional regulator
MSARVFEMQAVLCQALSHPVRLELVHALRDGSKRVEDLAEVTGAKQASVSRHLTTLRNCGLVSAQRSGHEMRYRLTNPKVAAICNLMHEVLAEQAAHDLALINPLPLDG